MNLIMGGGQDMWMMWSGLAARIENTLELSSGVSISWGISRTVLMPAGSRIWCSAALASCCSGVFR